jgi:hypothetical protein
MRTVRLGFAGCLAAILTLPACNSSGSSAVGSDSSSLRVLRGTIGRVYDKCDSLRKTDVLVLDENGSVVAK